MSIYTDLKDAGIKIDNHYSDLYVRDTPEVRDILASNGKNVDGWNVQPFTCSVSGERYLDIGFAFDPYYESLEGK